MSNISINCIIISINNFINRSQNGDPRENAIAERVNIILKDELLEKVHLNYNKAVKDVSKAISIYNHQRPHGSIDYLTPFDAHFKEEKIKRRWKSYYSRKKWSQQRSFASFKSLFVPFRYATLHKERFKNKYKLYLGLK